MVKFFYGMSGAFKGVTLTAEDIASDNCVVRVRSMIKPWKDLEEKIFLDTKTEDNRNYSLLHLSILKHTVDKVRIWRDPEVKFYLPDINIERGVTDSLFYYLRGKLYGREDEEMISRAVEEEMNIVSGLGDIRKVLLVNKDRDFIRDVVLKEPHRAKVFPGGVEQYLEEQDKYVSFTARWNEITDLKEISCAKDYIEGLGLTYIEN